MKVSLNWTQYYSNVDLLKLPKEELIDKIGAQLGGIEEVIDWGSRLKGALVVRVIACEKHPNADKLHICRIDDGKKVKGLKRDEKGHVQVVCGAPNVKVGMYAVWLPPGVTVPNTAQKDPLVLESRSIRGEISNGMLASAAELGISDDHSGIVELQLDQLAEGTAAGTLLTKALWLEGDVVIDIENKMFTHRPDCFGILGVARELAGIQHLTFKSPDWYREEPKFENASSLPLEVKVEDKKLVPRFMAVVMKNIKVAPSSLHIQADLSRVGIRPINNIVDITNYIMHLTGQPTHAYDYDKVKALSGSKPTLIARVAKNGEELALLNGKKMTFAAPAIMIATDKMPVGVGGIMGGANTEVDENTQNIILECANFDMYNIRRTAMKYGLFTDAVTRFNKGQSKLQNDRILRYAMKLVSEHAGGLQASGVKDVHGTLEQPKTVRARASFINERLGLNLNEKKIAELLENVEFKVLKAAGKQLAVTPPFWRTDIHLPEDVVEEVGRLYGYDHLPLALPSRDITPTEKDPLHSFKSEIRDSLTQAGANELLTYSFVHMNLLKKAGQDPKHAYRLSNALSPDLQYYRTGLTPSLLDKVHTNIKAGYDKFALFELGNVHYKDEWDEDEPNIPLEDNHLALVVACEAKNLPTGAPFYLARKYIEQIDHNLDKNLIPMEQFDLASDEWGLQLSAPYEPKRSAVIVKDNQIWGVIGEFKLSVRTALKLPDYTAGFELNLGVTQPKEPTYHPLPRFPKVEQDMTLKVAASKKYGEVIAQISEKLEELKPANTTASLEPTYIYQKDADYKHMTWRLSIASYERTLTDEEVNKLLDDIAEAAKELFGAERI